MYGWTSPFRIEAHYSASNGWAAAVMGDRLSLGVARFFKLDNKMKCLFGRYKLLEFCK
ncbi:hypothetical protein METHB2_180021 [Candidatus Methylobacter favarea]|uniref:Uncharacterized protein n=1 Tax=Candidatus Methylobacter favarea TaxID=2707345 RepID=A0A8S0Y5Y7_9GAMM|nr:hypothetical protein METHB2_180021 [Candidatus Methylobacter favarea]